ncbi:MAG: alanine racemase [Pseudomonadales bacterium]|nr:alanine racemase [Pseudomonadales bacterium]
MKTRALIDTQALAHNLAVVKQLAPGVPVLAVVKADAYGHGAVPLLPMITANSDALAVARLEEAQTLRTAGFTGRLLLLCGVSNLQELDAAVALQLDIAVHDPVHLSLLVRYSYPAAQPTTLWLKMDSGMHRLGITPEAYASAAQQLRALPWCRAIIGMTHFASADETPLALTQQQIDCYQYHTATLALDDHSLANSAGLIAWPAARRGWLRPGLMMYGINPLPAMPLHLKPVMQLEAQVIATRTLQAGECTGYNQRWQAQRESRIALIAAGYADGYPITALNRSNAAVSGVRVPVVGRVSMDTLAVDCTDLPTVPTVGSWVELWGNTISVSEVAEAAGSIAYELLTSVSARVPRLYNQPCED